MILHCYDCDHSTSGRCWRHMGQSRSRIALLSGLCFLAAFVLLMLSQGCGSTRRALVGDATRAVDAAVEASVRLSEQRQEAIIADARAKDQDPAILRERIAAHRAKWDDRIASAAIAAYEALYVAGLDPSPASLSAALAAGKHLYDLARVLAAPP